MNRLLLLALLLIPLASNAQIYRTTDEHGNVTFSDAPPPGTTGEQVELQQTNTAPPPPQRPSAAQPAPGQKDPAPTAYKVAISAPANETTVPMGPGNFSVSVSVEPALGQNDQLQLFTDGIPWGEPQQGTSWSLTNVFRGAHDLTVAITDDAGKQLALSEPVRVYVLRPSINNKNRR